MDTGRRWRAGNIPLPEPYLIGIGASLALHRNRPVRIGGDKSVRGVGGVLLVSGLAVAAWATLAAKDSELARPERLVADGPYKMSRNPMYLGWSLAYIGSALLSDSGWPLILLPGVGMAIHLEVLEEEQRLESRFGDQYREYVHRVRRYI